MFIWNDHINQPKENEIPIVGLAVIYSLIGVFLSINAKVNKAYGNMFIDFVEFIFVKFTKLNLFPILNYFIHSLKASS